MRILAIDTSSNAGSLALLSNDRIIDAISSRGLNPYSERLFRDLAVLQGRAGFQLSEMDIFAVATGPGSFTGLRVGLTAVKAWAEVHGKPVAAISGLEAVAAQSQLCARAGAARIAPFLDAHRGLKFGATYRYDDPCRLARIGEEAVLSEAEFLALVQASFGAEPCTLVSPTPGILSIERIHEMLPNAQVEQVPEDLAAVIGRLGYERALRGELTDALHLEANYIQRSNAELLQKAT